MNFSRQISIVPGWAARALHRSSTTIQFTHARHWVGGRCERGRQRQKQIGPAWCAKGKFSRRHAPGQCDAPSQKAKSFGGVAGRAHQTPVDAANAGAERAVAGQTYTSMNSYLVRPKCRKALCLRTCVRHAHHVCHVYVQSASVKAVTLAGMEACPLPPTGRETQEKQLAPIMSES